MLRLPRFAEVLQLRASIALLTRAVLREDRDACSAGPVQDADPRDRDGRAPGVELNASALIREQERRLMDRRGASRSAARSCSRSVAGMAHRDGRGARAKGA
jgi:hypothetical protein